MERKGFINFKIIANEHLQFLIEINALYIFLRKSFNYQGFKRFFLNIQGVINQ